MFLFGDEREWIEKHKFNDDKMVQKFPFLLGPLGLFRAQSYSALAATIYT